LSNWSGAHCLRDLEKLFTLSAIYTATGELLDKLDLSSRESAAALATDFWVEVSKCFPEWKLVRERKMSAGEVREGCIHSHGRRAPGYWSCWKRINERAEARLEEATPDPSKNQLVCDQTARSGRGGTMVGGHVQKGSQNILLTVNVIKKALALPLGPEEQTGRGSIYEEEPWPTAMKKHAPRLRAVVSKR